MKPILLIACYYKKAYSTNYNKLHSAIANAHILAEYGSLPEEYQNIKTIFDQSQQLHSSIAKAHILAKSMVPLEKSISKLKT